MANERRQFVVSTHETVLPGREASGEPGDKPDLEITAGAAVSGKRMLDVGCGPALDVAHLAPDNMVVGIDISAETLRRASAAGIEVLVGDAEGILPFEEGSFDVVILKDVFEHLLDPAHLLRESYRILGNGGTMVINVPNHFFFWGRLRLLLGKGLLWKTPFGDHTQFYDEWDYQHVRFFTWGGFQRFLAQVPLARVEHVWEIGELLYHPRERILARLSEEAFTLRRFAPILRPLVHLFF
ncbi:MAG: methyltransferase domain-containing protein, partial [Anaerolineae bacterium]|nr:methyltransferase domain-containing protein [Anaerolineae bacterium]